MAHPDAMLLLDMHINSQYCKQKLERLHCWDHLRILSCTIGGLSHEVVARRASDLQLWALSCSMTNALDLSQDNAARLTSICWQFSQFYKIKLGWQE
jgi:vesicle coat complex subunit